MPEFDRLLLFHALRPDRLTAAMSKFVANTMGKEYVTSQPFNLERSFQASPCPARLLAGVAAACRLLGAALRPYSAFGLPCCHCRMPGRTPPSLSSCPRVWMSRAA